MLECNVSFLGSKSPDSFKVKCDTLILRNFKDLESELWSQYGLGLENFYVLCNGRKFDVGLVSDSYNLGENTVLHVVPRTLGGKGGFGSMLRAIGAQIEKTTNREACRDLSGRRLRDINEEQRLKNWIAQQAEREKEAVERKQKKLERLCQEPRHEFKDEKYEETRSIITETMSSSVEQGFKAGSSGVTSQKRKTEHSSKSVTKAAKKKKTLWIDSEDSDVSSVEDVDSKESINHISTVSIKSET